MDEEDLKNGISEIKSKLKIKLFNLITIRDQKITSIIKKIESEKLELEKKKI